MPPSTRHVLLEIDHPDVERLRRATCTDERVQIGRSSSMDVTISNDVVSGHHLTLSWSNNSLLLRDESSTNGTVVNGHRLTPGVGHELAAGDDITIDTVHIRIADLTAPVAGYDDPEPTLRAQEQGEASILDSFRAAVDASIPLPTAAQPTPAASEPDSPNQVDDTPRATTDDPPSPDTSPNKIVLKTDRTTTRPMDRQSSLPVEPVLITILAALAIGALTLCTYVLWLTLTA